MELDQPYFDQIVGGQKIYELRGFDEKRKKLQILDVICFKNGDDEHKVFITELTFYNTFHDALMDKGVEHILPHIDNIDEAVSVYRSIPGYIKKEQTFGVLSIKFSEYKST